ncbi:Putative phosphatidic acid phosphatase type 2/haloperoxidase [Septoria linicola]|uniref:Phosphatidic acid phosphatase type 2/haloperoxidase n=1 Tax=Septoria linicola TaxID=215465 RepID=A0A9Q9AT75_9PEZI|nr:putative phosphatidic acid phosphatase type 2/haloperoxidase [Septoria linicola]USW51531.1 Putative phosphatidic acid phosphatase type 2/haloperoxidase [Septoria linicola]
MKLHSLLTLLTAATAQAQYSGDIVAYWIDRSSALTNNSLIGGLQSPPSGWTGAIIAGSIYTAALETCDDELAFQQLAVSHAAHNSLTWIFHGTRNFANIYDNMANITAQIGIDHTSDDYWRAAEIGRDAALRVTSARQGDKLDDFVPYVYGPANPGIYQRTPGGLTAPDTPQAYLLRPFGGIGNITKFRAPPPPAITSEGYEAILNYVKAQGEQNSTARSAYDTETAYFWRESSPIIWSRFAYRVIGNKYATDVLSSAKFAAQLNYALANAAIAGWDSKTFFNSWRPVTAIRRTDIWLPSGNNVSNPAWTPLLSPTPNHQEYTSTHACFGAAAAAVVKAWNNGSDAIDILHSTNATGRGVILRPYTSIQQAVKDNGDSRVFGGIHFQFASDVGSVVGNDVGIATIQAFDDGWSQY